MIIQDKDITRFRGVKVEGDLYMKRVTNFHNPTGVFFEKFVDNETDEFLFFAVAAINDLGEIEERQVFDGDSQESFFKAVDYFESLIEKRIPEKINEPPSIGIFCFIKSKANKPSFVDIGLQEIITIDNEDIEKVFTPPVKKKYGRLNMLEVDKPKYDVIKSKFALSFNQELTDQLADKFDIEKEDIFVYKLTPYQNQPQDPNQQQSKEPEDVNDDELSIDKIEGEEPEKMKGEKENKKEDSKKEKTGEKEDSSEDKDNSGQDSDQDDSDEDGDGSGQDSEEDDSDEDGNGSGQDSEEDDSDEDGNGSGQGGEEDDSDEDGNGSGQGGEEDDSDEDKDGKNKRKGGDEVNLKSPVDLEELDGDFEEALARVNTTDIIQQISNNYQVDDIVTAFRKQQRLIDSLGVYSQKELQNKFYSGLGLPEDLSKKEFIEFVKERTKPYFNK